MCKCGCNTCDTKSTALVLKENKFVHTPISEGLKYHIDNQIPLSENIYRIGSKEYMKLYTEARSLYSRGKLDVSEADKYFLTETHVGSFGMFEGKRVPLDIPMINEEEYYVTVNRGPKIGKSLVRSAESDYEEPRIFSKEEAKEYIKRVKNSGATPGRIASYWVSDRDMNRIDENEDKLSKIKQELEALRPGISWIDDIRISSYDGSLQVELDYTLYPNEIKQLAQIATKYGMELKYMTGKNASLVKNKLNENIDTGDFLNKNRDQIELDFGPRTFRMLQMQLMKDDEAFVRDWLVANGYMEEEKLPFEETKKLTYNDFVRMVRDDMMAGAAPDEKPSDKQVASRAKSLYNDYLQGASVDDLFEAKKKKSKLCKRGRDYIAARKRAGEKSSAYLSGRAVKVCKGSIKGAGGKKKKSYKNENIAPNHDGKAAPYGSGYKVLNIDEIAESLKDWFEKENWVRINTSGNITGPCGTMKKGKATTRCLPKKKAQAMTKAERKATVAKKVRGSKKGKQFVSVKEQTYSGFTRNPEDPASEPFELTGAVAQFKEELRALFGKFKDDLKNPEFIKGVAQIMINWKSLLRSQLKEATVDYDFSKEELIRVIKQLKRGASTEIGMIKAFEIALGRELTDDEIRGFKLKEAEFRGKEVSLNKPKRGGSKAYYVYVRDPKTKKIKKVSFGSGGLRAKIKNKDARNAFAKRHNCDKKKDRTKAGYWSCNLPRYAKQLGLGANMNTFW